MIKFNPALVLQLETTLGRDGITNLTRICSSHLVESNMFLRSLLLTLRCAQAAASVPNAHQHFSGLYVGSSVDMQFCNAAAASAAAGRLEQGLLCTWLSREEINIMFDLMTSVKEQDISTENICVFNTTLCMLLFKRLDDALPQVHLNVSCIKRS